MEPLKYTPYSFYKLLNATGKPANHCSAAVAYVLLYNAVATLPLSCDANIDLQNNFHHFAPFQKYPDARCLFQLDNVLHVA